MTPFRKRLSRSSRKRNATPRIQLDLEHLEGRLLLSGNPSLTLSIAPTSFNENAGAAAAVGTVTRVNTDNAAALTVNLTSSNTNQAAVPANVVIPAGQGSATFDIDAVDDHIVTGTQTVTISASANASVPLSADTSFGTNGVAPVNGTPTAVAVQSDGKVVTAGLYFVGGTTDFDRAVVSRYNTDGTPDTTFGTNGTVISDLSGQTDHILAVLIQPDGKIVLGGYAGNGPYFNFELARYNADGSLDSTFGTGGKVVLNQSGVGDEITSLALQPDGKILAAGEVNNGSGTTYDDFAVARFNSDGSLDTSFGTGGFASVVLTNLSDVAQGVVVQSNGDIVLAGSTQMGNYNSQIALVRFTPTGTLDSTFGSGGIVEANLPGWYNGCSGVALQPDGKLVVSGSTSPAGTYPPSYSFVLLRYNADGTLDNTFGTNGVTTTNFGGDDGSSGVALQPDGMILVAGTLYSSSSGYYEILARYLSDGSNDVLHGGLGSDVLIGGGGADTLYAGSGGDILIGGSTSYDDNPTALTAILAEWGRTDISYQDRIDHLLGTTAGGLNGSFFLNATTIQDDSAVDQLYGGAGLDWYLYQATGSYADVLHHRRRDEIATAL